jgi:hypothetical protein
MASKKKPGNAGKLKDLRPKSVSSAKASKAKGGSTGRRVNLPIEIRTPIGTASA